MPYTVWLPLLNYEEKNNTYQYSNLIRHEKCVFKVMSIAGEHKKFSGYSEIFDTSRKTKSIELL